MPDLEAGMHKSKPSASSSMAAALPLQWKMCPMSQFGDKFDLVQQLVTIPP
jgi:hypothetical protein